MRWPQSHEGLGYGQLCLWIPLHHLEAEQAGNISHCRERVSGLPRNSDARASRHIFPFLDLCGQRGMGLFPYGKGWAGQPVAEPSSAVEMDIHPQLLSLLWYRGSKVCYPLPKATEQLSHGLNPGLSRCPLLAHPSHRCHFAGDLEEHFLGLGCLGAHLVRVTRWHQEFLLLPCPGREVAPNLLMKRQWVPGCP